MGKTKSKFTLHSLILCISHAIPKPLKKHFQDLKYQRTQKEKKRDGLLLKLDWNNRVSGSSAVAEREEGSPDSATAFPGAKFMKI